MPPGEVVGVLLAAGAGRRAGGPKALRRHPDGTPWVVSGVQSLLRGGCDRVVVVLGCASRQVRSLLVDLRDDDRVILVESTDWADGMSRSLSTGLDWVARRPAEAALVHLVDLPDVGPDVVRRLLTLIPRVAPSVASSVAPSATSVLARAAYGGRPGHPVLVGADHLPPLLESLGGLTGEAADRGGKTYLADHDAVLVECGDLASGRDRDDAG